MIDKNGYIRNPLTVIAIFAGIAEISGVGILPSIAADNQKIFIYFLIWFPVLLVTAFFLTLNWNHKVLYAPSDFQEEENFFRPSDENVTYINKEIINEETENSHIPRKDVEEKGKTEDKPDISITRTLIEEKRAKLRKIENLSISMLSRKLHLNFETQQGFITPNKRNIYFDAVSETSERIDTVQIRAVNNSDLDFDYLNEMLLESELVTAYIQTIPYTLHYVVVLLNDEIDKNEYKDRLLRFFTNHQLNIKVYVETLEELESQY